MINKDFFPTPLNVIELMTEGIEFKGKRVLEPSAGSCNIVDYLNDRGAIVFACEIDEKLQQIVKNRARLLGSNFLELTDIPVSHIDYIIMNPPFSADEKHILHAFEIAPEGCEIIALCNANTIENAYSVYRKSLHNIIENYGSYTILGDVFSDSERKTNVNVALIKLSKPAYSKRDDSFFFDMEEEEISQENGLMQYSEVYTYVSYFRAALIEYDKIIESINTFNSYAKGKFNIGSELGLIKVTLDKNIAYKSLLIEAWQGVFRATGLESIVTSDFLKKLNAFIETQGRKPFTMKNIYIMLDILVQTVEQNMIIGLEKVFDYLINHSEKNRFSPHYYKTNSHYLLNNKFIFDTYIKVENTNVISTSEFYNNPTITRFDDFVKAICFFTGVKWNNSMMLRDFYYGKKRLYGEEYEHQFFKIKMFKKGTIHCTFLDPELCGKINQIVAKHKGYPLYKKV